MSVLVKDRTQGELEVIVKAKRMAIHTIKITNNTNYFPKRYRLNLTDKIVNKAIDIFEILYDANECYPINRNTSLDDFNDRVAMQRKAMSYCRSLCALIDMADEIFCLNKEKVEYWNGLVVEVRSMTVAWMKSDIKRFNNINK